jgi:hypothetical protein
LDLFPQAGQLTLELPDLEMQAPAPLSQTAQGRLIIGNFLAGPIQGQSMAPGIIRLSLMQAAQD